MDLKNINQISDASISSRREVFRIGLSLIFIISVLFYVGASSQAVEGQYLLTAAAVFGGYMALNIGANDVANNVGPAVGSKALSMVGAIVIAAIFEAAGALLAGGEVVSTIKGDIINGSLINNSDTFIWLMM
ncbi:MAG: inorganic phosphate transporter, partial [Gammaproteobacteria bacterium]